MIITSDGEYAMIGTTESFSSDGNENCYLIKTDSNGNPLWSKVIGGSEYDFSCNISETLSGNLIISGRYDKYNSLLSELDKDGNLLWARAHGVNYENDDDNFITIRSALKLGQSIFAFGDVDFGLPTKLGSQAYVIKTDSLGHSGCYEKDLNINISTPNTTIFIPSFIPMTPPTEVVTIPNADAKDYNSGTDTICSTVDVKELPTDFIPSGNTKLVAIYDILGREVKQIFPYIVYIYKYVDEKGNNFFKKEMRVY
ncbi:MAG: hypothetical protein V1781_02315 [Bacteroidota bacterium]